MYHICFNSMLWLTYLKTNHFCNILITWLLNCYNLLITYVFKVVVTGGLRISHQLVTVVLLVVCSCRCNSGAQFYRSAFVTSHFPTAAPTAIPTAVPTAVRTAVQRAIQTATGTARLRGRRIRRPVTFGTLQVQAPRRPALFNKCYMK